MGGMGLLLQGTHEWTKQPMLTWDDSLVWTRHLWVSPYKLWPHKNDLKKKIAQMGDRIHESRCEYLKGACQWGFPNQLMIRASTDGRNQLFMEWTVCGTVELCNPWRHEQIAANHLLADTAVCSCPWQWQQLPDGDEVSEDRVTNGKCSIRSELGKALPSDSDRVPVEEATSTAVLPER